VTALDNLRRRGSELNLSRLRKAGVDFLHGDIRNLEDLASVGPFDVMIECSAEPSVSAGYETSPEYVINTNLVGSLNCLESVRRRGAAIIFISSSRVYPIQAINDLDYLEMPTRFEIRPDQKLAGVTREGISEDFPLGGARSIYGATKLASELILQEYTAGYNIRGVINRCGVVTGPWQMGRVDQGFVVFWVARHLFGESLRYFGFGGTGKQVRDILHIEDLYRLISCQLDSINEYRGEVFNVGGGRNLSTSLSELTAVCKEVTGVSVETFSENQARHGDVRYFVSDSSRVALRTDWRPLRSVRDIVSDISDWITDNAEHLKPILSGGSRPFTE
jgi:CDP-paratose 2-epimerase